MLAKTLLALTISKVTKIFRTLLKNLVNIDSEFLVCKFFASQCFRWRGMLSRCTSVTSGSVACGLLGDRCRRRHRPDKICCSTTGCTNLPQKNGVCKIHGGNRICKIHGCTGRLFQSRMCYHHYNNSIVCTAIKQTNGTKIGKEVSIIEVPVDVLEYCGYVPIAQNAKVGFE